MWFDDYLTTLTGDNYLAPSNAIQQTHLYIPWISQRLLPGTSPPESSRAGQGLVGVRADGGKFLRSALLPGTHTDLTAWMSRQWTSCSWCVHVRKRERKREGFNTDLLTRLLKPVGP